MFILKYFKSLSARLLVLTLLWVSFVSGSIAWTMLVNWELEASASAKYAVGELRLHAYRAAYFSQTGSSRLDFDKELQAMLDGFKNVRSGDSWKPLLLPREPDIADKLDLLEGRWRGSIEPMFVRASLGSLLTSMHSAVFWMKQRILRTALKSGEAGICGSFAICRCS